MPAEVLSNKGPRRRIPQIVRDELDRVVDLVYVEVPSGGPSPSAEDLGFLPLSFELR